MTGPNPAGIVFAAVGVVVALGVISAVVAMSASRSTSNVSVNVPSMPGIPAMPGVAGKTKTPLSDLHTTKIDWMHDVPIDAPGMIGTTAKFDVLANWDWALKVGHAWWEDADMYEVSANPIDQDGTTNLNVKSSRVEYHMVSKNCKKDADKRAESEQGYEKITCSLELTVEADGPSVKMDLIGVDSDDRNKPIAKPACSIQQVFDKLGPTLTKRPAYAMRLEHDVFGLRYTITAGQGAASMNAAELNPNFCGAKPAATTKPTTTAAATTTQASNAPPFDRGAAASALSTADLSSCKGQGFSGSAHVTVTFDPPGTVSNVKVDPPLAGSPAASCVSKKLNTLRVPPFSGGPVTVGKSFSL